MKAFKRIAAVALVFALCGFALGHERDEARRQGYRNGYRDGYRHGQQDRHERSNYDFRGEEYEHADRGYDDDMGDRDDYRQAYRGGYKNGYDDGYYGRDRRSDNDDWRDRDRDDDRYGDSGSSGGYGGDGDYGRNRVPDVSGDPKWTSMDGKSIGYRDGVEVGLYDWLNQRRYNPHDNHWYSDADHWYEQSPDKGNFKGEYRRGFQVGYDEAFQSDRWHRLGGPGPFGDGFRRGAYFGFVDSNRAKPYNPQRLPDYQRADAQYQNGFLQGYGWVFQLRRQR